MIKRIWGGYMPELGELPMSNGLECKCAQIKAEESANSTQQLKAVIALCNEAIRAATNAKLPFWKSYFVDIKKLMRS